MKTYVTLILILMISLNSKAGGDSVRNGGDSLAQRFVFEARFVFGILKTLELEQEYFPMVEKLNQDIDSISVHSTDEVLKIREVTVDAINIPFQHEILLSRSRWIELLKKKRSDYVALIIHEYLGVEGYDDSSYRISKKLVEFIGPNLEFDPMIIPLFRSDLNEANVWVKKLLKDLEPAHEAPLLDSTKLLYCFHMASLKQAIYHIFIQRSYVDSKLNPALTLKFYELQSSSLRLADPCDSPKVFEQTNIESFLESELKYSMSLIENIAEKL